MAWQRRPASAIRSSIRPTLIVFLHPHCSCSRTTVTELRQIMEACREDMTAHVVFVQPDGTEAGWPVSNLWKTMSDLNGVPISTDHGGRESRLFGAKSSGHAYLFDAAGRLVFSGGITGSRSVGGKNRGKITIMDFVKSHGATPRQPKTCSVFGCPLMKE